MVCFALIISSLLVPSFIVKSVAVDQAHERQNLQPMEKFRQTGFHSKRYLITCPQNSPTSCFSICYSRKQTIAVKKYWDLDR